MGTTRRFFNTDGPVRPAMHYAIPPLSRVRLGEVRELIDRQKHFVMHAPRQSGKTSVLLALAAELNAAGDKPLVLLIDEIDALIGDSLISVLRQLRAGYDLRPNHFPQSVILCGVRNMRDYRIEATAENAVIAGA